VVSVGTYSAWEGTATLRLLVGARGAWAPTGGGEGRGHIVSPRVQLVKIGWRIAKLFKILKHCTYGLLALMTLKVRHLR